MLKVSNFIEKRLQHLWFPKDFPDFFKNTYFAERLKYILKFKLAAPDKFSEAAVHW